MPPAVGVKQMGEEAFVVAAGLVVLPFGFGHLRRLVCLAPIAVDDGLVSLLDAAFADRLGIVGSVGEVVDVRNALRRLLHQWNHCLRVVQRGGGVGYCDGDAVVGDGGVDLAAFPVPRLAVRIPFRAPVAVLRKLLERGVGVLPGLPF